jgi:hypothetical protein
VSSVAIAHIRRNSDGKVVCHAHDLSLRDGSALDAGDVSYMWLDGGNYSCDCNRYLFFERAEGRDPEWNEGVCGETDYSVLKIEMPDGTVIEGEK